MVDLSICEMQLTQLIIREFLSRSDDLHSSDRNVAEQVCMKMELAIKSKKFREKFDRGRCEYESGSPIQSEGLLGNEFRKQPQHKNGMIRITFNS